MAEFSSLNGYDVKDKTARESIEELKDSYLINEIETKKINVSNNNGNVYITTIPHLDNENNIIPIKHDFANDVIDTGAEKPTDFSYRKNATFVSNASVFEIGTHQGIPLNTLLGVYIHNGELIKDNRNLLDSEWINNRYILGIKEDNTLKSYRGNTSVADLLNDGVKETVQAMIPILINGENNKSNLTSEGCTYWADSTFNQTSDATPIYNKIYYTYENNEYVGHFHLSEFTSGVTYYDETTPTTGSGARNPRQIIGQKSNKDIIFITNNGKGDKYNVGLSLYDFTTLAKYYGCTFAFVLDGGGSTASVYKNEMLNHPTDGQTAYSTHYNGEGLEIRPVSDFLYFSKEVNTEKDNDINYLLNKIQELEKRLDDFNLTSENKYMSTTNFFENSGEQHIINFKKWNSALNDFFTTFRMYVDNPNGEFAGGMSINYVDEANSVNEPVIRFGNTEAKGIRFLSKKLGLIYNEIPKFANDTDLNSLSDVFVFGRGDRDQNLTNAPFTTETYNYFVIQFGFSNYRVQFAISLSFDTIIKVRVLTSSWSPWKTLAFES